MTMRTLVRIVFWRSMLHGLTSSADIVQFMDEMDPDLGETRRRDPDALPPTNAFETAMYWVHHTLAALGHGNVVFAIKAGLLTGTSVFVPAVPEISPAPTVILSIPYRLKNSAHLAYSTSPVLLTRGLL